MRTDAARLHIQPWLSCLLLQTLKHSMEEISENEVQFATPSRRRPDLLTALMAGCTGLFLAGSLWMRFGPEPMQLPPKVGDLAPRLDLTDLQGREHFVFDGITGKVLWITFRLDWARDGLKGLERIWKRHEGHRNFEMLIAAIDAEDIGCLDGTDLANADRLPLYRATAKTCTKFGLRQEVLPVHFVIDTDGRILGSSLEAEGDPLTELETIVRNRLEELDPGGGVRFASQRGSIVRHGTDVVAGASER